MSTYHRKKLCIRARTVVRRYRGQGIGRALLRFVVRWALDNDLDFIFFDDNHAHSLRVLPAFLNRKMDKLDARAKDTLYWEVKHYSTPWFKEQREERKMKLAQVKDRSPCRSLSLQHDLTERRGRPASRTLTRNSLENSPRRGLASRSSMDTNPNDHSPELRHSVMPEDFSRFLDGTDEAGSDTVNFTASDGGYGVEDEETAREEECIRTAINEPEQNMHECREGHKHTLSTEIADFEPEPLKPKLPKDIISHTWPRSERDSAHSVRFDKFSPAQSEGSSSEESLFIGKDPERFDVPVDVCKDDFHDIDMSGHFRDLNTSEYSIPDIKADLNASNPSTPAPSHDDTPQGSINDQADRPAHFYCGRWGCRAEMPVPILMEDVSPLGTWFEHKTRLCSACALEKAQESIYHFESRYDD